MIRQLYRGHGGSCLITPASRSLTILPNQNSAMCESSITLAAIAQRVELVRRSQTSILTPRELVSSRFLGELIQARNRLQTLENIGIAVGGGCRNRTDDRSFAVTATRFRGFQRVRRCSIDAAKAQDVTQKRNAVKQAETCANTEEQVYPRGVSRQFSQSGHDRNSSPKILARRGTDCCRLAWLRQKFVNRSLEMSQRRTGILTIRKCSGNAPRALTPIHC